MLTMAVAFFDVHDAILPEGEISLIYLVLFIIIYITGPGRYSIDFLIDKRFQKDKKELQNASNA
jgi:putative oxidoreductase